ncbi:MAG: hypothetical protein ACKVP3_10995 [Hyphomicrobiaceae bacterium]
MFCIGQKIVCVENAPRKHHAPPITLQRGAIYTVRACVGGEPPYSRPGVLLEEIRSPISSKHGLEWAFYADRFRPIRTTSIDTFLKMLEPTPETV